MPRQDIDARAGHDDLRGGGARPQSQLIEIEADQRIAGGNPGAGRYQGFEPPARHADAVDPDVHQQFHAFGKGERHGMAGGM